MTATATKKMSPVEFKALYEKAHAAGMEAGRNDKPPTMVVQERARPLDDTSPVVQQWVVPEGPCGFAWITIRPANCAFANWLRKNKLGRTAYGGGLQIWVGEFNQSMSRKEAYANAFARVIREAGIPNAWAGSRMD